ncbi:MAG: hypothetical protein GY835_05250 [bacterium]|nr:hypothetical protein [bacterium]
MSISLSRRTFLTIFCILLAWVLLPVATGAGAGDEYRSSYDFCSWDRVSQYGDPSQRVMVLATYDDGTGPDLFAGGEFVHVGSLTAHNIVRWTGVKWQALVGDIGEGVDGTVLALGVFDDGSGPALFVGGRFETACGVTVNNIAKWDGSSWSDLSDATGTGVSADDSDIPYVWALASYDDGTGEKLYVAGTFAHAGGEAAVNIASWDGSSWSALPSGDVGTVKTMTVHDDGLGSKLYVGGHFYTMILSASCPEPGCSFATVLSRVT